MSLIFHVLWTASLMKLAFSLDRHMCLYNTTQNQYFYDANETYIMDGKERKCGEMEPELACRDSRINIKWKCCTKKIMQRPVEECCPGYTSVEDRCVENMDSDKIVKRAEYGFIPAKDASSFLKSRRFIRSTTIARRCDSDESFCESHKVDCMPHNEINREDYCRGKNLQCPVNQVCYFTTPCPAHFSIGCSENRCYSFPCKNGGTCTRFGSSYKCSCPLGYDSTKDCTALTEKLPHTLKRTYAHVHITRGFYVIRIQVLPEKQINECASNPCQNGGKCTDLLNNYRCTCVGGYSGTHCEKAPCNPACKNGGSCIALNTCQCKARYTGETCELGICSPPCQNNGTCIAPDICSCQPGYLGDRCQLGGSLNAYLTPIKDFANEKTGDETSWYQEPDISPFGATCFIKIGVQGTSRAMMMTAETTRMSGFSYGNYTVGPMDEKFSINASIRAACLEFRCPDPTETVVKIKISVTTSLDLCRASTNQTNAFLHVTSEKGKSDILTLQSEYGADYGPKYGVYKAFGVQSIAYFIANTGCQDGSNYGSDVMNPTQGTAAVFNCQ